MNILLTGVAGFIASRVASMLLDDGHSVVGLDNMNDAYDIRLKEYRLAALTGREGFHFLRADIADRAAVREAWTAGLAYCGGEAGSAAYHGVVNLAARAGVRPSVDDPWVYMDTNAGGNLNLLDLCREYGVRKYVLASTSSLYGVHNPLPYAEEADTNRALSPYAASKKAAEAMCYTYHYLHGIDVTVFRYFTVYGPAGRPDMSPLRFTQWIHEGRPVQICGDGLQSRDFTYVDDIASGTILGLRPLGFEVINLGSDRPVGLGDFIALIEGEARRAAERVYSAAHPADVQATWADISKAERLLGWKPQVQLEEGVARLAAWYRENREWAREIVTD
ncbi:MAG: GDP-mannose 4,6-dehydratase [Actinobacteria bacterium]|nr:GDP-mannose 4,6-dehydratase [Actinomycetota bacterium]